MVTAKVRPRDGSPSTARKRRSDRSRARPDDRARSAVGALLIGQVWPRLRRANDTSGPAAAGEPLVRLDVALPRRRHDVVGQARRLRGAVPAGLEAQPVAEVL